MRQNKLFRNFSPSIFRIHKENLIILCPNLFSYTRRKLSIIKIFFRSPLLHKSSIIWQNIFFAIITLIFEILQQPLKYGHMYQRQQSETYPLPHTHTCAHKINTTRSIQAIEHPRIVTRRGRADQEKSSVAAAAALRGRVSSQGLVSC